MYERSYGYRYEEGEKLSTPEIAKLIRKEIKTAIGEGLLPARWKYSVRSESFSGGSSIDVRVKDCADAWMPCPGYQRLSGGGRAGCRNAWCKAGGIHMDLAAAEYHDVLTEEAEAAEVTLKRIHGAFNHDGSDSMIDYFDVNYYGTVSFDSALSARFEAEEKARKAARRAALDAAEPDGRVAVYGRAGTATVHAAVKADGKTRLLCGARLWGSYSLYSRTDAAVTCSRCAKRQEG